MLAGRVARELEEAGLADRAIVFQAAVAAARVDPPPHPMGLPVLLLDLPLTTACEAELVAALARSAPDVLATAPADDGRSLERMETALECAAAPLDAPRRRSSLSALLALLACRTERLSARRFAEYVSLAQVPDPGTTEDADARWTPPDDDLLALPPPAEPRADEERGDGIPRAPWRWERLLVEASV